MSVDETWISICWQLRLEIQNDRAQEVPQATVVERAGCASWALAWLRSAHCALVLGLILKGLWSPRSTTLHDTEQCGKFQLCRKGRSYRKFQRSKLWEDHPIERSGHDRNQSARTMPKGARNSCSVFIGVYWLVSLFYVPVRVETSCSWALDLISVFEPLAWCGNAQQGWDWLTDSWLVRTFSTPWEFKQKLSALKKGPRIQEIIPIFKDIQDAILLILHYRTMLLIPNNFFAYISHIGCAVILHSHHQFCSRDDQIILQQYVQQVESLSPENRLSKFCKEAGFMSVVEVGQYFVTRDAGEFQQTVACREYTLPRDDKASEPKGRIRGNTRIGPILEVTTSFQHFKFGVEVRIQSVNEDNSHSWVRISYGTVRYVNNYIKYAQSLADTQEEDYVPTSAGVVAARSKAKAKPQPRESTGATTIPLSERKWIDIETIKARSRVVRSVEESHQSSSTQSEITSRARWSNSNLQNQIPSTGLSSSNTKLVWWSMVSLFGCRRRIQTKISVLLWLLGINHLSPCSSRTFWGQSHWSCSTRQRVDWTWSIPWHLPRRMRIQSSSIIGNGLILGGQILSRRQSVFFLPVDPRDEDHKDPENIDYSVPRHARYVQNTWERHQDTVFWIDIDLGIIKRRIEVLSNKIERNYSSRGTSSKLYCKSCKIQNWRSFCMKDHTCLLDHHQRSHWDTITTGAKRNDELGSAVEQQPVGKIVRQFCGEVQHAKFSPTNPTKPNQSVNRSGKPENTEDVFVVKGKTSRSHEIDGKRLHEELGSSDRSGKPDELSENIRVKQAHDGTGQLVEPKQLKCTHSWRTIWSWRKSWHCVIQHGQRVQPCNQRGEHWLQHSRITQFCSETITWRQRSKFDSEDREPLIDVELQSDPTTSTIQSFQQRITRRD